MSIYVAEYDKYLDSNFELTDRIDYCFVISNNSLYCRYHTLQNVYLESNFNLKIKDNDFYIKDETLTLEKYGNPVTLFYINSNNKLYTSFQFSKEEINQISNNYQEYSTTPLTKENPFRSFLSFIGIKQEGNIFDIIKENPFKNLFPCFKSVQGNILKGVVGIDLNLKALKEYYLFENRENSIIKYSFEKVIEQNGDIQTLDKFENNDNFLEAVINCDEENSISQLTSGLRDINYVDSNGNTVLMIAIIYNLEDTALKLISFNCDLEAKNNDGLTALDLSLQYKRNKISEQILENSLDVEKSLTIAIENNFNKSAYFLARKINNYSYYLPLLQKNGNKTIINYFLYLDFYKDLGNKTVKQSVETGNKENDLLNCCKFGLNHKALIYMSELRFVYNPMCLVYACISNSEEIALELIDRGINTSITYLNKDLLSYVTSEKIMSKLLQKETSIIFSDNFKIFNPQELIYGYIVNRGTFGNIYTCIEKSTGKELLLKGLYDTGEMPFVSDLIKEIYVTRLVNSHYPDISPKLLGLLFIKDQAFLVMKNEGMSLHYYDKRRINIEKFSKQIIQYVYEINSLGILHRDLHKGNILIDHNGNSKIIDFGACIFLGSYPNSENINIVFPDSEKVNWLGKEFYGYQDNSINYSSDSYSLGVMICSLIYGLDIDFYSKNNSLYYSDGKTVSLLSTRKIKEISNNLEDLLIKMLDEDPLQRITSFQAMDHQFFTSKIINNPLFNVNVYGRDIPQFYIPQKIDLTILDEIHLSYKNDMVNYSEGFSLKNITYDLNKNYDQFFNSIFTCMEIFSTEISKQTFQHYTEIFGILYCSNEINERDIKGIFQQISQRDIRIKPVSVHIFEILENNLDFDIFRLIVSDLYKFLLNVDYSFNIWNVISVISNIHLDQCNAKRDLSNSEKILETLYK